jgi:putative spermidine/putrescine transport system permease protein
MLLPLFLFLSIFFAWPVAQVLILSVSEPAPGFSNYVRLVNESGLRKLLWTTLRVSVMTTMLTVALGYLVAYVMARTQGRRLSIMLACVLLPFWLSVVVQAFSWIMLLRANGVVNGFLQGVGVIDSPLRMMRNEFGVQVGMVHFLLPVAVLMLLGNMRGIDRQLVQAANSLGANAWQAFAYVFFPQSLPGLVGAATIVMIVAMGFYITPALLGGGKTVMVAEYISVQILQVAKWGVPAMLATVLLAAVACVLMLMSRIIDVRRLMLAR